MNEGQWLTSIDPVAMLDFVHGNNPNPLRPKCPTPPPGDRKLRLFAVACCAYLTEPKARRALLAAERIAEGLATLKEARLVRAAVSANARFVPSRYCLLKDASEAAERASRRAVQRSTIDDVIRHRAEQAALLRDIVGNPFRQATLCGDIEGYPVHHRDNPVGCQWCDRMRTPTVLALAETVYRDRQADGTLDPHTLAVLSDALEEASCTDLAILDHLRGPGPHVRGCWALDLILGKE